VNRRRCIVLAAASLPLAARAHHGWSSFDLAKPVYLEGRAVNVAWRNPHAELDLDVAADLTLPADLAQRTLPAQTAQVDGPALLKAARPPARKDKRWHIELAPLSRMAAWKMAEIKNGDALQMVGFTFAGERGEPILRVEYVWVGGKVYGLRSSPG
jgi:Family of unknown function (DUF6152)